MGWGRGVGVRLRGEGGGWRVEVLMTSTSQKTCIDVRPKDALCAPRTTLLLLRPAYCMYTEPQWFHPDYCHIIETYFWKT